MPLVTCPDCGHQVSTAAATCPQCNRPLAPQLAATGPVTLAAPAEQIVWEGVPSLKAMVVEFAVTAFYAIALPIVVALAFDPLLSLVAGLGGPARELVETDRPTIKTVVILLVVVVVGWRAVKLAAQVAVLRSHRYPLSKRIDEVDMRTVEDIEFQQRFLERLLGIGQIAIVAADKKMSRFRLLGVENPREVRELIRAHAFQATQGQLFTRGT